jgi:ribosomal-protein-alanine N-acetyltransferase
MAEVSRASGPRTALLALRRWQESDLAPFAELNADPETMEFFPAPLTRAESDDLVRRIEATIDAEGYGFWAVERRSDARFIGMVGLSPVRFAVHFAPTVEIGWRLARPYWGRGYATEAATASLAFGFEELGMDEIVSFTSLSNTRSAAVMARIGMHRDPPEDFDHPRIPVGHPLRRHQLWRLRSNEWAEGAAPRAPAGGEARDARR